MWEWQKNSILYNMTPYTATRDIFQAVCNEIGRYYGSKELKYTKSKRILKWKGNKIRCEFGFWSSHSNIRGEWVNLETVTSVFALEASGMERNGILDCAIRPKNFNVYQIDNKKFEEIIAYIDTTLETVKTLDSEEMIKKLSFPETE